jgi:hypothetical protein
MVTVPVSQVKVNLLPNKKKDDNSLTMNLKSKSGTWQMRHMAEDCWSIFGQDIRS